MTASSSPSSLYPSRLWLLRHGESAGNVARDRAEAAGAETIDVSGRDMDVPLSPRGEAQARAVGEWFGAEAAEGRPTVVLSSPYLRARQTAQHIVQSAGLGLAADAFFVDERLREKELGSLDRLTRAGIVARFPQEAALRTELGKFYYRPPRGESWADVVLRLRSVVTHLEQRHPGERVMIVAHQVVVLCLRYILEQLDEAQILAIDRRGDVANCSLTEYRLTARDHLELRFYNEARHLAAAGQPVTAEPGPEPKR